MRLWSLTDRLPDGRRFGSYLGEGWYGYDIRKYLEVPC